MDSLKQSSDLEMLLEWAHNLKDRLIDPKQNGGCPSLSKDGTEWKYSFMPKGAMYMEVEQMQALFRHFGIKELEVIEYGGECSDCIHGANVSSSCGFWPHISDCDGCRDPQHQHFIPHEDLHLYVFLQKEQVFTIPCGGTIPIYVEKLKKDMEDAHYDYYEAGGYVRRVADGKRICKMTSLGQLNQPGNKRNRG